MAEGPWETFERAALARIESNASSWVSWPVCVALAGERCQRLKRASVVKNGVPMIQIMEPVVFTTKLGVLAGYKKCCEPYVGISCSHDPC